MSVKDCFRKSPAITVMYGQGVTSPVGVMRA